LLMLRELLNCLLQGIFLLWLVVYICKHVQYAYLRCIVLEGYGLVE
jgi:hypothetical protein